MAKIILTVDGTTLKEVPLIKERSTIGRRSNNDLVIDHVAISGEHAVIVAMNNDFFLEDLNSTNGTQVNGQPVKKHFLQENDVINLAPYKIRFVTDKDVENRARDQGMLKKADQLVADAQNPDSNVAPQQIANIRVLSGPSSGKEITLGKPLTTIGRPGVQVAVITHRKQGYFITHVEGASFPLVNGTSIGANARQLKFDDVIDLSGTRMVFKRRA
jgi:hypothetical protein